MARRVFSIEHGQDYADVTEGATQSAKALAIDIDLADNLTDAQVSHLVAQVLRYMRDNPGNWFNDLGS